MKDSTVRINDVLAFIQTTNLVTAAERLSAHQLAANFIAASYPTANAGQPAYENFSTAMSLGYHMKGDPNALRNKKRACYMLVKAIEWIDLTTFGTFGPMNIAHISDGAAPAMFVDFMRKAACVRESATGATASVQQAMNALYNQPLEFLRTNKLIVMGSTLRDATQGDQNAYTFTFRYQAGHDRYVFDCAPVAGAHQVLVDSVLALYWTTIPGSWVAGNAAGGDFSQIPAIELASQFMVTTQFTGCAFCMKRHNGHVYCAHVAPTRDAAAAAAVQPPPVLTGTQIAQRVAMSNGVQGDFSNAAGGGPVSVFGAGFSHNIAPPGYPNGLNAGNYMTVVGVQRGTNYEIYSQVTQNGTIQSPQRIF